MKEETKNNDAKLSNNMAEKEAATSPRASLRTVLKSSDSVDMLLMALGTIGTVADGSAMALIMLVLSSLMNSFASKRLTHADINKYALDLLYVAVGVGSGAFLEGFCWARTAERQTFRIRRKYLEAVLRQDVGFFETNQGVSLASQVVSCISIDTLTIQGAITEKIPNFIMNITIFITGQLVALYLSWKLALVAIPALLALMIPGIVYGKLLGRMGERVQKAYKVAGGITEQAVSSIRTVFSYVGEERMAEAYKIALEPTLTLGIKQGLMKGMTIGIMGVTFAVWALQGWYGSVLIIDEKARGGNVFTAGLCIIYAGLALGGALLNVRYFIEANIAASRIFDMILRIPSIDSEEEQGQTISDVKGEVQFRGVDFEYPSRPGSLVLSKFDLRVMPGQTVGLVGRSGTGKSTVINLLERFYEPLRGAIFLDGIDVKTLQPKWIRSQMGLVSQEPILFATSIKDNILFGKEDGSMEDVVLAAKAANAHTFISQLPEGYDTQVGQSGSRMSEGQKQRICIARALIRDPRILLLDEATSALDSHSEKAVQDALNYASVGRTTISIAHRLSTIRDADLIAVIQSGQVVESGSHDQLLQNQSGAYSLMVQLQSNYINEGTTSVAEDVDASSSISFGDANAGAEVTDVSLPQRSSPPNSTNMELKENHDSSLLQLIRMTAPELKSTIVGCIAAVGYGLIQPLHSFCMASLLAVYFSNDHNEIRSQTRKYCFAFLAFAVFAFLSSTIQHYHFGIMGESLTKRVREALFDKILLFEAEWFDQEDNSSGAICSRLATDAVMVRTLVADRMSLLTQGISSATLAVVLAMVLSWRLALVTTALQPLIIGAFYGKAVTMRTTTKKILKAQNKSSNLASEAVGNHRIITAFYCQEKILKLYEDAQASPKRESNKQSWYAGFGLSVSQFLTATNTALTYWYGGRLLMDHEVSLRHLFQTFFILVSTGRVIAETGSMTADLSKGANALKSIFRILNRKSKIDPDDPDGIKPAKVSGGIEFKAVYFSYPTRPNQIVLRAMNLKIDAGNVVALVGQSGSGKSTIIKLIERFYDTLQGAIEVDGINITRYNVKALRSHIALVSQEPTLFMGTIHDNIAFGKENATEAEIIEAATIAHAHDFISTMTDGYVTNCGEKGVQLSVGQKQRIALARAILKNPAVLLLDEATSALDVHSEALVQDALDRTMCGRTCVAVAHRLSTVQKAHKIAVVGNGKIIEEGTHRELLTKGEKGAYYSLLKLQQLSAMR